MTATELVDYLSQFPADTCVFLTEDDVSETCEFIALDTLDYGA